MKRMSKSEKWFREVFLPSFDKKFEQNIGTKYEGRIIISDKQAQVCYQNMESIDYGGGYDKSNNIWSYTFDHSKPNDEFSTHVMKTTYEVVHLGKYYFLEKYSEDYIYYHTLPDNWDDED